MGAAQHRPRSAGLWLRSLEGTGRSAPLGAPSPPGPAPAHGTRLSLLVIMALDPWLRSPGPCVSDCEAAQRARDGEWERAGDVGDADGAGAHPGRACRPGAAAGEQAPVRPQVTSCALARTRVFPSRGLLGTPCSQWQRLKPGSLDSIALEFRALAFPGLNRIAPLASVSSSVRLF